MQQALGTGSTTAVERRVAVVVAGVAVQGCRSQLAHHLVFACLMVLLFVVGLQRGKEDTGQGRGCWAVRSGHGAGPTVCSGC